FGTTAAPKYRPLSAAEAPSVVAAWAVPEAMVKAVAAAMPATATPAIVDQSRRRFGDLLIIAGPSSRGTAQVWHREARESRLDMSSFVIALIRVAPLRSSARRGGLVMRADFSGRRSARRGRQYRATASASAVRRRRRCRKFRSLFRNLRAWNYR